MTETAILSIAGVIISGLFGVLWYFVQRFIRRTEDNEDELVATLDKLNSTMNEINRNLIVFRTSATDQFNVINDHLKEIKSVTEKHAESIEDLEGRVKVIETHHSRNHPNDKL